jgi:hypothetical protein
MMPALFELLGTEPHAAEYMEALDVASSGGDIGPFAKFVASSLRGEMTSAAH